MKNQYLIKKIIPIGLFIGFMVAPYNIYSQEDWPCNQVLHGTHNVHMDCNEGILITSLVEDGETGSIIKGIITTSATVLITPGYKSVRIIPVDASSSKNELKTHTTKIGNGGNVGGKRSVAKELNSLNKILVYPNPTKDIVNVSFTKTKMIGYELFNLYGYSIKRESINPVSRHSLSIKNLKKGMYLLKIRLETDTFLTRQVFRN